jgi:16S rRNA (uracil1498-N3)-methyltransferase
MHRFFIPPTCIDGAAIYFPMEVCRQMATVLHLREGEHVMALDGSGSEHVVELSMVAPRSTAGRILETRPAAGEPRARLTLYLALAQREKFEWMLQKCTEVGAAEFVPVFSARSLVQSVDDPRGKLERWQRIVQEAAEQSARGRVPPVQPPLRWNEALQRIQASGAPALAAWEGEQSLGLRAALQDLPLGTPPRLSALVGPEGGFSEEEMAQARAAGLRTVTLGRRILRMETAAVVLAALILEMLGEM